MCRWVAEQLREVGYPAEYVESGDPPGQRLRPASRIRPRSRGAAGPRSSRRGAGRAADWSKTRSRGGVRQCYVWGRGAVDMKGYVRDDAGRRPSLQTGESPLLARLVFAFVARGTWTSTGAVAGGQPAGSVRRASARRRRGGRRARSPCRALAGSVDSISSRPRRRGLLGGYGWCAGCHGSMVHDDNAVTTIARAVTRLGYMSSAGAHRTGGSPFAAVSEETGLNTRRWHVEGAIAKLGRWPGCWAPPCATPPTTMLKPGYKGQRHPGDRRGGGGLPGVARSAGGVRARG